MAVLTLADLSISRDLAVVWLRAFPAALGPDAGTRLAWRVADTCAQMREDGDPLVALCLQSEPGGFFAAAPVSAADCDTGADAWAAATAAVAALEVPTVAVIEGDAIGRGWELALACDLRIAATTAHVGNPEVRWGRMPSAGGSQRLARLVGPSAALRLLLLGEILAGPQAFNLGMVDRLAPPEAVKDVVAEVIDGLRRGAPLALAYAKEATRAATELSMIEGLRLEADLSALLQTTTDRAEGVQAFRERRAPRFTGQ